MIVGETKGIATVKWDANPVSDMIADAIIALLMHAQSSTASIRITSKPCCRRSDSERLPPSKKIREYEKSSDIVGHRLKLAFDLLCSHFEDVQQIIDLEHFKGEFIVSSDMNTSDTNDGTPDAMCIVTIEFGDSRAIDAKISVQSDDEKLASNVREHLSSLAQSATPIQI